MKNSYHSTYVGVINLIFTQSFCNLIFHTQYVHNFRNYNFRNYQGHSTYVYYESANDMLGKKSGVAI